MATSQNKSVIVIAKLMKKKSLKDSPYIEVGETFIGYYFDKPEIGKSFSFFGSIEKTFTGGLDRAITFPFRTSTVTKIIDEFTFETINSVYYLIDKDRERDIKIEDILK